MLTDAAYMPSVEEIAAYGLDETGLINKYLDQFRQVEQERGPGYVAQQMALNEFGYGYGFVRKVNTGEIDNSKVYLQDMALKGSTTFEFQDCRCDRRYENSLSIVVDEVE